MWLARLHARFHGSSPPFPRAAGGVESHSPANIPPQPTTVDVAQLHRLLARAREHVRLGNWDDARAAALDALAADPQCSWTHYALGEVHAGLEEWHEAAAAFERAAALAPEPFWPSYRHGHALWHLNHFEAAARALRAALRIDPDHFWARYWLGLSFLKLERWKDAARELRAAIRLDGRVAWAHGSLSIALGGLRRWNEAAVAARRAIDFAPAFKDARSALVRALVGCGDLEGALEAMQELLFDPQRDWQLHAAHGDLLVRLGRANEAAVAYRHAVDEAPRPESLEIGDKLVELGRVDYAIAAYVRGIVIDPTHASGYQRLARLLASIGRAGEARMVFQRGAELGAIDPGMASALVPDHAPVRSAALPR